ncbi:CDP-alcohol phosphatidyltransferase family protein [uncultured Shimia sp.]|uniref:CDP-alcohol phosphatidyltransferase family protein n=1 Tax=uncultured Shimia sp. TaxID=573152 RepID=UPI00261C7961|nr:CDP-alcohol phosphatidyltransferase family protein [uncultured Shimia sp.]
MAIQLSLREIVKDLKDQHVLEEWRGEWAIAFLFRVPSQLFVWVFLRLGWTPLMVTGLGFVLSLIMPALAVWLPLTLAVWSVVILGALFQILDCADGTLARATGRSSVFGADMDYLVGMFHYICIYASVGLIADRYLETGTFWALMGVVAVAGRLLARLVREQIKKRIGEGPPGPFRMSDLPGAFVSGLSGLIPFGVLAGSYTSWVIVALLVYSVMDIVDAFVPMRHSPYRDL